MNELLAAALGYAAAGMPVLPLKLDKTPRIRNGLTGASCDVAVVAEWWRRWPDANIGVVTGPASGFAVVDVDPRHGGDESLAELERVHGKLSTALVRTGSGGRHFWFRAPADELRNSAGALGPGLDVRGEGGYVVAPPSVHVSGGVYTWERELEHAVAWPEWLSPRKRRNGSSAEPLPPVIRDGEWHRTMVSAAGTLRRRGFSEQAALAALVAENAGKYEGTIPPDSDAELAELVADVYGRYPAEQELELERAYNGVPRSLDDVVASFRRFLHVPDPSAVYVVLATELANRIPEGDPVWVVIVAGSSRGKTELLLALDGLPGVRVVGSLTVAALLSGTGRKERSKTATGGVLVEIGARGLLVVKDLGAILSLHRDTRAQVLQALRDVYDGLYTRDVGVDGGTKLEWRGRVGLLAGATSALDQAHAVLSALGERWLTVRLGPGSEADMAKLTLRGVDTAAMRAELRDAVHGFLASVDVPPLRLLSPDEEELLAALAVLVCFARSPVERERDYRREIVLVHQPEGPGRMARQLHKLYVALEAMGVADAAGTLARVGLDSIPAPRREVLLHLLAHGEERTASRVARKLRLPTVSARRSLEELAAHGLLEWRKSGDAENASHLWKASARALELWQPLAAIAGVERD